MGLIDEKGRLLGKINVVDLGVVIVVAIVVLAAARFTLVSGAPVTVHAQIDARDVPADVAQAMTPGSTWEDGRVEVTDVHRIPTGDDRVRVFAKMRVRAEDVDDRLMFGQDSIGPGNTFSLTVSGTSFPVQVVLIDDDPQLVQLASAKPAILVVRDVPPETARALEGVNGGVVRVHQLLENVNATTAPTSPTTVDVYLRGDVLRFSGNTPPKTAEPLVRGTSVTLQTPEGSFDAEVRSPPGRATPDVARSRIQVTLDVGAGSGRALPVLASDVGAVERAGSDVVARVVDLLRTGGPTVQDRQRIVSRLGLVTSGGGSFAAGGAPPPSAHVTLEVLTVEIGAERLYKGVPLGVGSRIQFEGETAFSGTVTAVGRPEAESTRVNVTLEIDNVPPWVADRLEPGSTETTPAGRTLLEITDVRSEAARIVTTTADGDVREVPHPSNLDLTVSADLVIRSGRFKDTPVEPSSRLFVRPAGIPLDATVVGGS